MTKKPADTTEAGILAPAPTRTLEDPERQAAHEKLWKMIVITSYSIHYTKLYDLHVQPVGSGDHRHPGDVPVSGGTG